MRGCALLDLLLDMELFFGYCYFVESDYEGERERDATDSFSFGKPHFWIPAFVRKFPTCHPRMFLAEVQGFESGFPPRACGNDDLRLSCFAVAPWAMVVRGNDELEPVW
jgi:hypothetical protein